MPICALLGSLTASYFPILPEIQEGAQQKWLPLAPRTMFSSKHTKEDTGVGSLFQQRLAFWLVLLTKRRFCIGRSRYVHIKHLDGFRTVPLEDV